MEQDRIVADLTVRGFIAESVTYRIYTSTEDEALYLTGVLNSTVVNKAIKPYQTGGVYHGKRDIHRRPFEVCPIPEFDNANPTHLEISSAARAAKKIIEKWGPKMEGGLAKVREKARKLVSEQLHEIDDHVTSMLSSLPKEPAKWQHKRVSAQHSIF